MKVANALVMLFLLAGFNANAAGDRIIIREYVYEGGTYEVYIYENGTTTTLELPSMTKISIDKRVEALNAFGKLVDKYLDMGYKITASSNRTYPGYNITDFILEKQ